jgi:pilus assembly protein CpaF
MEAKDVYQRSIEYFLGPVGPLLADPSVSEILINGHREIYYEKEGRLRPWPRVYEDAAMLEAAAVNIAEYVGRPLDADHPAADARLPEGHRVHMILPPLARERVCVSIRKFPKTTFTLDRVVESGGLTPDAAEFLGLAVLLHKNVVISGGTGTGKTSMLNALSGRIPREERIVVIEDSSELKLDQPHTIYLEARPSGSDGRGAVTIRDLFAHSLRMRPDRIVVGEVRRGEAIDMLQSMISGHSGSLSTVHAASPGAAATRLEMLSLQGDAALPIPIVRDLVARAVDLVVQIARDRDGFRRVTHIAELLDVGPNGAYIFRELYRFRAAGRDDQGKLAGRLEWTGARPSFAAELFDQGYDDRVQLCAEVFATDRGKS